MARKEVAKMNSIIKKPSAWIPIALPIAAFAIMLISFSIYGVVHEADEGVGAHLFQIFLMVQAFAVMFFAVRWLPINPKPALVVLALQVAATLLPMAVVFSLRL